ncbi:MAG: metallophosphoesterase family protein [Lawsonibacter sp.]
MKILVFSDSHRSLSGMYSAIEMHHPDHIIHLGDLMDDAREVALAYPRLPFCMVPGNCDGWSSEPAKKQIHLAGIPTLLSHGHIWGVKSGFDRALADARASQSRLLLFGHTHKALCCTLEDGLQVLNPGSSRSTYGIISILDGQALCSIQPIP